MSIYGTNGNLTTRNRTVPLEVVEGAFRRENDPSGEQPHYEIIKYVTAGPMIFEHVTNYMGPGA
jgi:hypothetical protein